MDQISYESDALSPTVAKAFKQHLDAMQVQYEWTGDGTSFIFLVSEPLTPAQFQHLARIEESLASAPFLWRTRRGEFISPKNMQTSHLFFTVRMIWNHTVPEELKLRPYNEYTFDANYSKEYMAKAAECMLKELATRTDLTEKATRELNHMTKTATAILEAKATR